MHVHYLQPRLPEVADMPHLHVQAAVSAIALQPHRCRWLGLSLLVSQDGSMLVSRNKAFIKRLTYLEDCQTNQSVDSE